MASSYTRQSASQIASGQQSNLSAPYNNEFNQLEAAFSGASGHDHSGGSGLGPTLTRTALNSFGSNTGLVAVTSSTVFTARTITGTANQITVTNGDGVAGNPTLSLPSALTFTGLTITGGTLSGVAINTASTLDASVIGGITPAAGSFTSLTASTTLAVTGAATLNSTLGVTGAITGSSTVTATKFIPTSSSAPTNGLYLPSANSVGLSTNSTVGLSIDSSQNTTLAANVNIGGNIAVNTNKFTVTGASGNTVIGGTLAVTGAATLSSTISASNLTGSNTGDQTITLTGNVTGSGTGSFTTTIAASAVTNAMLAGSIAASKLVGSDIATVGTITSGVWNAGALTSSGAVTGTTHIPTGSVAPTNGFYIPSTNTPGISASGNLVATFASGGPSAAWVKLVSSSPAVLADGSATDIALALQSKGAGNIYVYSHTGSSLLADFIPVVSAVNYLTFAAGSVNQNVAIGCDGSNTDIDLALSAKGAGNVRTGSSGSKQIFCLNTAKVWVAFTSVPSITSNHNVTSITKNSTGDYTVNFTSNLTDANYSISGCCTTNGQGNLVVKAASAGGSASLKSTSQCNVFTINGAGTKYDPGEVYVQIFGN